MAKGRGGARPNSGPAPILTKADMIAAGSKYEQFWRQFQRERLSKKERAIREKVRKLQKDYRNPPKALTSLPKATRFDAIEKYRAGISEQIDRLGRLGASHEKRPWGAKPFVVKKTIRWCKQMLRIKISERRVAAVRTWYRRWLRETRAI
jgi:hypothetical protein